jgi:hypothetical protein
MLDRKRLYWDRRVFAEAKAKAKAKIQTVAA